MFLILRGNENYATILDLSPDALLQILFVWINVIFIVVILSWLLYKPVSKFLSDRKERIANDILSAELAKKEAEENRQLYIERLASIDLERDEILDKARRLANEKEAEIISLANDEAELIRKRAELEIERAELAAKDEIRKQIIEVGSLISERFISKNIDEKMGESLLDEAISDLRRGEEGWA